MRIRRLIERGGQERGFAMILVLITLMVASLLVAAALAAAQQDARLTENDLDQKQAYLAAKAGIADYQFFLGQDPNYWTTCPAPTGSIPGDPNGTYSVTPLPATGQSACDPNNPVSSMIENSGPPNGTFRVRSSGFSNGVERSIVATSRTGASSTSSTTRSMRPSARLRIRPRRIGRPRPPSAMSTGATEGSHRIRTRTTAFRSSLPRAM